METLDSKKIGVTMRLKRPLSCGQCLDSVPPCSPWYAGRKWGRVGARVGGQEAESNEQQLRERLLDILSEKALGKSEISARLGQKSVSGPLNQLIRQLVRDGVIEMTIPEKPNSRLQKYRLVFP